MKTICSSYWAPREGTGLRLTVRGGRFLPFPGQQQEARKEAFVWGGGGVTFFSSSWIRSDPAPGDTVRNVRGFGRRLGFFGALWRFAVGRRY